MSDIYVHHSRTPEVEISRDIVAECTSIEQLRHWFERLGVQAEEIGVQIGAYRQSGIDTHRACQKLTYVRVGQQWVKRRLDALGAPVSIKREENQRREIARHKAENEELRLAEANLRKALEPFIKIGEMLEFSFAPALFPDNKRINFESGWSENGKDVSLTAGHFRAAYRIWQEISE